jgi:hypothetical protein
MDNERSKVRARFNLANERLAATVAANHKHIAHLQQSMKEQQQAAQAKMDEQRMAMEQRMQVAHTQLAQVEQQLATTQQQMEHQATDSRKATELALAEKLALQAQNEQLQSQLAELRTAAAVQSSAREQETQLVHQKLDEQEIRCAQLEKEVQRQEAIAQQQQYEMVVTKEQLQQAQQQLMTAQERQLIMQHQQSRRCLQEPTAVQPQLAGTKSTYPPLLTPSQQTMLPIRPSPRVPLPSSTAPRHQPIMAPSAPTILMQRRHSMPPVEKRCEEALSLHGAANTISRSLARLFSHDCPPCFCVFVILQLRRRSIRCAAARTSVCSSFYRASGAQGVDITSAVGQSEYWLPHTNVSRPRTSTVRADWPSVSLFVCLMFVQVHGAPPLVRSTRTPTGNVGPAATIPSAATTTSVPAVTAPRAVSGVQLQPCRHVHPTWSVSQLADISVCPSEEHRCPVCKGKIDIEATYAPFHKQ